MEALGRHSPILLSKIKVENEFTNDRSTAVNLSQVVSPEIPGTVKQETTFSDFPDKISNSTTAGVSVQNVKSEPAVPAPEINDESGWAQTSTTTGLFAEIKEETEDESNVIHELVCYLACDSSLRKELSSRIMKSEDNYEDENILNNGVEHYSLSSVSNESVSEKALEKPCINPKVQSENNSNCIKLVDVSVTLYDLFSIETRMLGKAHSNGGSCTCIYCRGDYRYVCESQSHHEPRETELSQSEPKLIKNDKRLVKCEQCSATFKQESLLNIHMKTHSGEKPFSCKFCSITFSQTSNLQRHIKSVHDNEKPLSCEHCATTFNRKDHLNEHMRIHRDERPFSCQLCPATFKQKCVLQTHLRVHSSEKPFSCTFCSKTFSLRSSLQRHIKIIHSNEKPFSCKQCSATFKLSNQLNVHMRVHTGERPFRCKQCSAAFILGCSLKNHIRIHTDEKPFSCKLCSKTFSQTGNLQTHIRSVHSNERPFSCEHCAATFKLKFNLMVHLRIHTGEKPFSCTLCSEKFSQKSGLQQHMRNVHNIERPFSSKRLFTEAYQNYP